jgi:hypothetical protein
MGFNRLYLPPLSDLKNTIKIVGKKKYFKLVKKQDAFSGDPESMEWLLGKLKELGKKKKNKK